MIRMGCKYCENDRSSNWAHIRCQQEIQHRDSKDYCHKCGERKRQVRESWCILCTDYSKYVNFPKLK